MALYGRLPPCNRKPESHQCDISRHTSSVGLLTRLPPSLKRLRVGSVVSLALLSADLLALTRDNARLCKLCSILIDGSDYPSPKGVDMIEQGLAKRHIEFDVRLFGSSWNSRGMLGPRPASQYTEAAYSRFD